MPANASKSLLALVLGCTLAFGFVLILAQALNTLDPGREKFEKFRTLFEEVEIGDSSQVVLARLGEPDYRESEFRLGQEIGYEQAYARAAASQSVEYWLWHRGTDIVFTIGLSAKDTVEIKEYGGT